jgi:hypothetical protein
MGKWINITSILLVALALRCLFMAGFVLGDDPTYGLYAHMIIQGMYPPLCDLCVFAFRPLLLLPVALSLDVLGWSEFNFILPILAASLISIYLIYALGRLLFDTQTGLAAGFLLAVFPLDLVHATTLTNDILLGMLVALAMLLFLKGLRRQHERSIIGCIAAGLILGSATGVKLNALPLVGLFIIIGIANPRREKTGGKGVWCFLLSWAAVQLIFAAVYYALTGDFLAHIRVELNYDTMYNPSCFVNSPGHLKNVLLYYPALMLGLQTEGHPGYTFLPYGFLYPVFLVGVIYCVCRRERGLAIPLLWFAYAFLMMEFSPMRISPYYQPIHRLARFLAPASIPAILVTALCVRRLFSSGSAGKILSMLLITGLTVTSLHQAYRKSSFYQDCMADAREVYAVLRHIPHTQVITDYEMKGALLFYNRFSGIDAFKSFEYDSPSFPPGSLVIMGGSRRPDASPFYAPQFMQSYPPRPDWLKIYEITGRENKVWRKANLVIYKVLGE